MGYFIPQNYQLQVFEPLNRIGGNNPNRREEQYA